MWIYKSEASKTTIFVSLCLIPCQFLGEKKKTVLTGIADWKSTRNWNPFEFQRKTHGSLPRPLAFYWTHVRMCHTRIQRTFSFSVWILSSGYPFSAHQSGWYMDVHPPKNAINVGKTIVNHPTNTINKCYQPFPNGWCIVLTTSHIV